MDLKASAYIPNPLSSHI